MKIKLDKNNIQWGVTAFLVLAAGALVIMFGTHLKSIFGAIKMLFGILAPIIYGLFIAYLLNPIMKFLEEEIPVKSLTVMVQKEVADRMRQEPGSKEYGALSLAVQYYAKPEIMANVPPNCFIPRPNVASAVIRLTRYEKPPVEVKDDRYMFALIRASFNQRRKTLANALSNDPGLHLTREQVMQALETLGMNPLIRGEMLSLEQFASLSNIL